MQTHKSFGKLCPHQEMAHQMGAIFDWSNTVQNCGDLQRNRCTESDFES